MRAEIGDFEGRRMVLIGGTLITIEDIVETVFEGTMGDEVDEEESEAAPVG